MAEAPDEPFTDRRPLPSVWAPPRSRAAIEARIAAGGDCISEALAWAWIAALWQEPA